MVIPILIFFFVVVPIIFILSEVLNVKIALLKPTMSFSYVKGELDGVACIRDLINEKATFQEKLGEFHEAKFILPIADDVYAANEINFFPEKIEFISKTTKDILYTRDEEKKVLLLLFLNWSDLHNYSTRPMKGMTITGQKLCTIIAETEGLEGVQVHLDGKSANIYTEQLKKDEQKELL